MRATESKGNGLAAMGKPLLLLVVAALCLGSPASRLRAMEEPIFTITFRDGALSPNRLEVPANARFQLQLVNDGDTPVEFESNELRKEKVIAPKSASTLVIRTLDPGEYTFFDDFHPETPPALLVAK